MSSEVPLRPETDEQQPMEPAPIVLAPSRRSGEASDDTGTTDGDASGRDHWLVRDPIRTGFLLILVVSLVVRLNVLRDSYFIVTDDFMLMSRAVEVPMGWDYLTRVHAGHLEPVGFAVMWLLAHLAPWNWGVAVAVIMAGLLLTSLLVWRLLVELFGPRRLVLVPFAIFSFTPLTLPATTWLSAAIISVPLMASLAGLVTQHARYLRTRSARNVVGAGLWLVLGLLSFEKTLVALPYLIVLTLALQPQIPITRTGVVQAFLRSRPIWALYGALTALYVWGYTKAFSAEGAATSITLPTFGEAWDFVYLSVFRTLIPAAFGGPWRWQSVGSGGFFVDSPHLFEWLALILAAAIVVGSLALRRNMMRHWLSLLTYVTGSLAVLAIGRVGSGGSSLALETRYLADAAVPLTIVIGAVLMPLLGEKDPWLPLANRVRDRMAGRSWRLSGGIVLGAVLLLSLHAMNAYASISSGNPYRAFVTNIKESLASLPPEAQIYNTSIAAEQVGPIFDGYNAVSKFLAPVLTPEQREAIESRTQYANPYYLDTTGRFQLMRVVGSASPDPLPGLCGWNAEDGRVSVPLNSPAFPWEWAVRVGYLADQDTPATIRLGDAEQEVQLHEGLGEVFVKLVGGGNSVVLEGLNDSANVCVGDVQVGNPTTK